LLDASNHVVFQCEIGAALAPSFSGFVEKMMRFRCRATSGAESEPGSSGLGSAPAELANKGHVRQRKSLVENEILHRAVVGQLAF
jgi:hypothetical protein